MGFDLIGTENPASTSAESAGKAPCVTSGAIGRAEPRAANTTRG
jgi:hypothetical protein